MTRSFRVDTEVFQASVETLMPRRDHVMVTQGETSGEIAAHSETLGEIVAHGETGGRSRPTARRCGSPDGNARW